MFLSIFNEPIFYIIGGIIFVLIIVIVIIVLVTNPPANKGEWETEIQKALNAKNISYDLLRSTNSNYDYELIIDNKKYLIKMLGIPQYSEVQINNFVTWEIKYGAGKNPGKVQPFKKYAHGIEGFMNLKTDGTDQKVVILSPEAKKITKYINECEIVFVNSKTNVYGTRVINETDFSLFIK